MLKHLTDRNGFDYKRTWTLTIFYLPTNFVIFFLQIFGLSYQASTIIPNASFFPHWFIFNGKWWSIIRSIDQNKYNIKIEMEILPIHRLNTTTKNTEIPKTEFMLSLRNEISLQRYHIGFLLLVLHFCVWWFECVCVYACVCVLMHWYQF